jgi:hypothetical protein
MSFWTSNAVEPKRNFRWRVSFSIPGSDGGESKLTPIWWAKTVDTPSYEVTSVEHSFFDNTFKFPGRVKWNDVKMTLVDPITPNAVQATNQIILNSGYYIKDKDTADKDFGKKPTSITKSAAVSATGVVMIEILNGAGAPVETWTLKNPFITNVSFSNLDYSNDDMRTIDLTWRYDWAECENKDIRNGIKDQFKKS